MAMGVAEWLHCGWCGERIDVCGHTQPGTEAFPESHYQVGKPKATPQAPPVGPWHQVFPTRASECLCGCQQPPAVGGGGGVPASVESAIPATAPSTVALLPAPTPAPSSHGPNCNCQMCVVARLRSRDGGL